MAGRLLVGTGDGDRPAIVLFNGFPAGPNIPRIATDLQAAGYTVLLPQYRGTGHSEGVLSLSNSREDGSAAVDWLQGAGSTGVDVAKIAVLGVSYGGWVALETAAADKDIRCAVALVPADMGVIGARWAVDADYSTAWKTDLEAIAADPEAARFGSGGVEGFMAQAETNAETFKLAGRAPALADRPIFVAGGRQDPAAPFADHYMPLVAALRAANAPFSALEFQGGHNPSEASAAALGFIQRTCFKP